MFSGMSREDLSGAVYPGNSFSAMSDPRANASIEKSDLFDSGIEHGPGESCGGHGAIGIGAVNDDQCVRKDGGIFEGLRKFKIGQEVAVGWLCVVGIILRAIGSRFQIGRMHLQSAGKVCCLLVHRRVIGRGKMGLDELDLLLGGLEALLEFMRSDQLKGAGLDLGFFE